LQLSASIGFRRRPTAIRGGSGGVLYLDLVHRREEVGDRRGIRDLADFEDGAPAVDRRGDIEIRVRIELQRIGDDSAVEVRGTAPVDDAGDGVSAADGVGN
jgi:hypothetical protein